MDTRKLEYSKGSEPHCQAQIFQEDGDGKTIAITYSDDNGATAAELVKRYNAYPNLVGALNGIMVLAEQRAEDFDNGDDDLKADAIEAQRLVDVARALLATLKA